MTGPRYYVVTVEGYRTPSKHGADKPPGLSAHVLDRLVAHRIVASFPSEDYHGGGLGRSVALNRATDACERLNAAHEDEAMPSHREEAR